MTNRKTTRTKKRVASSADDRNKTLLMTTANTEFGTGVIRRNEKADTTI